MEAGPVFKYYDETTGKDFNFGQFNSQGELRSTYRLSQRFLKMNLPMDICREYLDRLVALIPAGKRADAKGGFEGVLANDDWPRLETFLTKERFRESWFEAIDSAIEGIKREVQRKT